MFLFVVVKPKMLRIMAGMAQKDSYPAGVAGIGFARHAAPRAVFPLFFGSAGRRILAILAKEVQAALVVDNSGMFMVGFARDDALRAVPWLSAGPPLGLHHVVVTAVIVHGWVFLTTEFMDRVVRCPFAQRHASWSRQCRFTGSCSSWTRLVARPLRLWSPQVHFFDEVMVISTGAVVQTVKPVWKFCSRCSSMVVDTPVIGQSLIPMVQVAPKTIEWPISLLCGSYRFSGAGWQFEAPTLYYSFYHAFFPLVST